MTSNNKNPFRNNLGKAIFEAKYKHDGCETWDRLARTLADDIVKGAGERSGVNLDSLADAAYEIIRDMKFIPGGRYLYYAGRPKKFIQNCALLRAEEDTREEWAGLANRAMLWLMSGAGIGVDYSVFRPSGAVLASTGGIASGPISVMHMINEIGRNVIQGGTRRSAIYASLNWQHGDIDKFLVVKDWDNIPVAGTDGKTVGDLKKADFDYIAPLDMTNISVNYDTKWLMDYMKTGDVGEVFRKNVEMAMRNGEPGFSFNFFDKERETLRNAPVSKHTRVLVTDDDGINCYYTKVAEIVNKEVTVWTGKRWAKTVFRKTKDDAPCVRVNLSNGRYIVADVEHPFFVGTSMENFKRVPAGELKVGDKLVSVYPGTTDYVMVKVMGVTEVPNEDVYCCDVGVSEHSFMAEGVIISNCTEVTSEDDSDVCNLGSINLANIDSVEEFKNIVEVATAFLLCGSIVGDMPYERAYVVREKNRRVGLGLMGVHEWLLKRGYRYEWNNEFEQWMSVWKGVSDYAARKWSSFLNVSEPVGKRAIAPTGTIGMLAGTTTGIEPVFAVAYKRRYLKNNKRYYQYNVDSVAQYLIHELGLKPEDIETSHDLAMDPERRISFQASIQRYVDMAISSTLNLPYWGSKYNNEDKVDEMVNIVAKYAKDLRGLTFYPDGSRGGQPLVPVDYSEAVEKIGIEYLEENMEYNDACKGGVCGV